MADDPISKGAFASLCNVDKSRVSQWIKEGKISGSAIVGSGRLARIRPSLAQEQLRTRLDTSQRLGNGFGTQLTKAAAASKAAVVIRDQPEEGDDLDGTDDVDRKLKQAKLEALERSNRIAAMEEAATDGTYVDAAEAAAEMGKIAARMMTTFEGWMIEFATAMASRFKLDTRDAQHVMHEQYRACRARSAEQAAKQAEALPATVQTLPNPELAQG